MEGYQYEWKDEEMRGELQTGLIAQQLESIGLGHVVDSQGSHKKVKYLALIPYLVEAIHELSAEVRELRAQRDM